MSADLEKIFASKRAYRQRLAALPIGEKLRLLDQMRERELALRGQRPEAPSATVREEAAGDGTSA